MAGLAVDLVEGNLLGVGGGRIQRNRAGHERQPQEAFPIGAGGHGELRKRYRTIDTKNNDSTDTPDHKVSAGRILPTALTASSCIGAVQGRYTGAEGEHRPQWGVAPRVRCRASARKWCDGKAERGHHGYHKKARRAHRGNHYRGASGRGGTLGACVAIGLHRARHSDPWHPLVRILPRLNWEMVARLCERPLRSSGAAGKRETGVDGSPGFHATE